MIEELEDLGGALIHWMIGLLFIVFLGASITVIASLGFFVFRQSFGVCA
ncbi:MAG TPA: hypothetical protein VIM12_03115 [Noviherbaspirillum sp.]